MHPETVMAALKEIMRDLLRPNDGFLFCRSLIERFAAISKAEIKAQNLAYKAVGKTDIEKWHVCQNCSQNMTKI